MNNYRANVFAITTEDGSISWGASFPDVECVVGGGDTPEEAVKEAYENLSIYLSDKKVAELPATPSPYFKEYSGRFLLRISKKLHRDLTIYAEKEALSLNAFCAETLARAIGEKSVAQKEKETPKLSFTQYTQIIVNEKFVKGGQKW